MSLLAAQEEALMIVTVRPENAEIEVEMSKQEALIQIGLLAAAVDAASSRSVPERRWWIVNAVTSIDGVNAMKFKVSP